MRERRIQALRNLAERPGTEAEGIVAREMLARHEAKRPTAQQVYASFETFLRTGSLDDLADAVGYNMCDCGTPYAAFTKCQMTFAHDKIRAEMLSRFPKGTRVYYNRWAYDANCAGTVVGYSETWNWMRIKFDHLKNARSVPVYSRKGWHISTYEIDSETLAQTGLRG